MDRINLIKIFNYIHRFILLVARIIFRKIYGDKGEKVPPVKNLLLLDPASVLAFKIRTKRVTSVEVVEAFIERIQEINPLINCVVDNRFDDALKEAKNADELIASGVINENELTVQKPFLGVPFSVKDSIGIEGLLQTCGVHERKNFRATKDAEVVAKLRSAGAIPFAITNVPELLMEYESNNVIFGRTKNPYDTSRIAGGSSGGEGALQASCGSAFGIGSDIGGSIRIPAFCNGIFGHKPSRYVISNQGQFPLLMTEEERHMLSTGPLCRYACDLVPIMKILVDEKYLKVLRLDEPVDIKKLKIFYQEDDGGGLFVCPVEKDIKEAFQKVLNYFKENLKLEVNRVQMKGTDNAFLTAWANFQEAQNDQDDADKSSPWIELMKWIVGKSNHTFAHIFLMLIENLPSKKGTKRCQNLMRQRDEAIEDFKELLKDENSVFLYPTHPTVACYHNEALLQACSFSYVTLFNILGFPSCAIPLGLGNEGVPLGIQCAATYNNDRLCLAVATELEKTFGGWVKIE